MTEPSSGDQQLRTLVISSRPLVRAALSFILVSQSRCTVTEVSQPDHALHAIARVSPMLVVLDLAAIEQGPRSIDPRATAPRSTRILMYGGNARWQHDHWATWAHVSEEAPVNAIISAVTNLIPHSKWEAPSTTVRLTPRQAEVLYQASTGKTNQEIGEALCLSPGTVKRHLHDAFDRLRAKSRTEAVTRARELGLLLQRGVSSRSVSKGTSQTLDASA